TATVKFNVIFGGEIDSETETWFVAYDAILGWQLLGDQRIVDLDTLNFHCNDYDGTDGQPGGCGINVSFWDENFDNNGTGGAEIASGTMTIIGADGIVKDTVYLGTADYAGAGEVMVYDEATGLYQGDWKAFGGGLGQIDPAIFAVGDIIEYKLYTADLNISTISTPFVVGTEVATYSNTLLFTPSTTGLYPTATDATLTAINNYTIGNDLTVSWTSVDGTVVDEVLIEIQDSIGNRIEIWDESFASDATSTTITTSMLDDALFESPDFDPSTTSYTLLVRIYASDVITGQSHSTDYRVDTSAVTDPVTDPGTTLVCGYESTWDDLNDEPSPFNSYTDFEAVVADCNGPLAMTAIDVIGTWVDSWTDSTGVVTEETVVFNTDGTGTFTETEDGIVLQTVPLIWTVATNNLMTLNASVSTPEGTISIMEVWALTGASTFTVYTEQSGWSSNPDLSTLDATAEGEIWNNTLVKQ
ncbi:MAG: hypothetical protein KAU21_03555, partial [Gammaproteobacteria bacterium]|nr:hypothetical protein [Gammaproteobacteria bacterium]